MRPNATTGIPDKSRHTGLGKLSLRFTKGKMFTDFEALRGLIDEGVSFRGPVDAHEGAASFIGAMRNSGPMIERVNVIKMFVDGGDVCAIFDFVTNQPSIGVTPCAEWYRVEEGKIKSMKLFFDASPYEALFKSGATAG